MQQRATTTENNVGREVIKNCGKRENLAFAMLWISLAHKKVTATISKLRQRWLKNGNQITPRITGIPTIKIPNLDISLLIAHLQIGDSLKRNPKGSLEIPLRNNPATRYHKKTIRHRRLDKAKSYLSVFRRRYEL